MTSPDHELIERLLHEEESAVLDFKRDQYAFIGTDDRTKSELLKDILAFANSWRHATAYILVGVEEHPGHRCKVVGISIHFDDARLQQFVNQKTNRPVNFQYRQFHFEGVDIGIIEISEQERPVFLNRNYGKLEKDVVYIRRGSSTAKALPDEIFEMGRVSVSSGPIEVPQFSLEWADLENEVPLSSSYIVKSLVLEPELPEDTFDIKLRYATGGSGPFRMKIPVFSFNLNTNQDYSKEIISYSSEMALLTPLGFVLKNNSGTAAQRVVFEGSITKFQGLVIQDHIDKPSRSMQLYFPSDIMSLHRHGIEPSISDYHDHWRVKIDFGDVRPREERWTTEALLFGAEKPGSIRLEGELLGDNIPDPISCLLEIRFGVERRDMRRSDVEQHMADDLDELS